MKLSVTLPAALAGFLLLPVFAQTGSTKLHSGVEGQWREPTGSVISVAPCGVDVCATLIAISPSTPYTVDGQNPDAAKKTRPLCGLRIGTGFHSAGPDKADGGSLYDPKSGKTYHGTMTAEGDTLSLRGYIGIKAFGRTEKWTRTSAVQTCAK